MWNCVKGLDKWCKLLKEKVTDVQGMLKVYKTSCQELVYWSRKIGQEVKLKGYKRECYWCVRTYKCISINKSSVTTKYECRWIVKLIIINNKEWHSFPRTIHMFLISFHVPNNNSDWTCHLFQCFHKQKYSCEGTVCNVPMLSQLWE